MVKLRHLNELEISTYQDAIYVSRNKKGRKTLANKIENFLDIDKPKIDRNTRQKMFQKFNSWDFDKLIKYYDLNGEHPNEEVEDKFLYKLMTDCFLLRMRIQMNDYTHELNNRQRDVFKNEKSVLLQNIYNHDEKYQIWDIEPNSFYWKKISPIIICPKELLSESSQHQLNQTNSETLKKQSNPFVKSAYISVCRFKNDNSDFDKFFAIHFDDNNTLYWLGELTGEQFKKILLYFFNLNEINDMVKSAIQETYSWYSEHNIGDNLNFINQIVTDLEKKYRLDTNFNFVSESKHLNELKIETYQNARRIASERGRTDLVRNIDDFLNTTKPKLDRRERVKLLQNYINKIDFTPFLKSQPKNIFDFKKSYRDFNESKDFVSCIMVNLLSYKIKHSDYLMRIEEMVGDSNAEKNDDIKNIFNWNEQLFSNLKFKCFDFRNILYTIPGLINEDVVSQINRTTKKQLKKKSNLNLIPSRYLVFNSYYDYFTCMIIYCDENGKQISVKWLSDLSNEEFKRILLHYYTSTEIYHLVQKCLKMISNNLTDTQIQNIKNQMCIN